MSYRRTTDFEEHEYARSSRGPPPADVRVMERERESVDRTPAFLRQDARRAEAGPMVLRQRDVETFDRHRGAPRSPSPPPPARMVREERLVRRPRSDSPSTQYHDHGHEHEHEHERSRTRIIDRERIRSPSLSAPRRRSPSPVVRFVEREREREPVAEHEHIHIVERERERAPERSPSPPPVVRGPTIERDVITHYTDVDHGVVHARQPSPPPRTRGRQDYRETDIDIELSKNRTEVDIRKTTRSTSRSRSRHRHRGDELIVRDTDRLRIDDHGHRRRARSAAPLGSPVHEEEEYLTSKIDSRGRMGEAYGGATRDWTIVDVPPGTERVHMDGVGGGATDTTWSRYSGVRRTKFIPERDGALVHRPSSVHRHGHGHAHGSSDRLDVSVHQRDLEVDIERRRRRASRSPAPPPPKEMWTEITRDLVTREAIERMGYRYEETKWFYYIMEYLPYNEVMRLVDMSESIRRRRRQRAHEIELDIEIERRRRHGGYHHDRRRSDGRYREMEVIYDHRQPAGGYYY